MKDGHGSMAAQPRDVMRAPDSGDRACPRIHIQSSYAQDDLWLRGPLCHEVAAAFATKMPQLPGRGLESADNVLTGQATKV